MGSRQAEGGTPGTVARWLAWEPPSPGASYRPQLDGLRAVAVLLVLYSHFWDDTSYAGLVGVKLFFVLSGYLITGLLIEARDAGSVHLGRFYLRRGLRLWPAYYLVLGLAVLANAEGIRAVGWWHALYASNVLFLVRDDYVPWYTAAWWSLAVEEQFYLLWPPIVTLLARRWLAPACGVLIALSVAFCAAVDLAHGDDQLYGLLPAVLDCLAGGALLVVLRRTWPGSLRYLPQVGVAGVAACIALMVAGLADTALANLPTVLALAAIVDRAAEGARWVPGRALASPLARYLGRISYGIYLYHLPLWWCAMQASDWWRISTRGPFLFVLLTGLTILVASLSWFVVEAPLNRLKARFPFP